MANIALSNGKFIEVDSDDDVDYELATEDRLFGSHINAIPIQSAVQGPRLFYGARFENQALPLKDAEVPLVQNQDLDTGLSFDKLYGKYAGAIEADDDFTVEKVDPDQIVLRNRNGEKVIKELYNNTPFNRKTSIHNTPLVKPGDAVAKGQVLAKSNYTDDNGTLAMGKNALVGLVAYKGHSMDDAIAISESFAGKLTSEHSETHALELDPSIKINKNHFRSLFPENYKKEQLEKVDDDGVVTPGTILQQGDPIFLSTKPRTINSSSFTSGKLTKGLAQAREDTSLKWDYPYAAEVVDVYKGRKGIKVLTKAYAPAQKGDKIVFRSGQKSFHKDTEVFTNRGWVLISELKNDDLVFSLFNSSGTYHSEFTPVTVSYTHLRAHETLS
jgi:DNA-directed RNA polymerase beta subunit